LLNYRFNERIRQPTTIVLRDRAPRLTPEGRQLMVLRKDKVEIGNSSWIL
jgi:hypothetical protein